MRVTKSLRLTLIAVVGLAVLVPLVHVPWIDPAPADAVPRAVPRSAYDVEPSYRELPLRQATGTKVSSASARTEPFGMVGVTWPARASSADVEAKIRVRRNGTWAAWERLTVEDDHGPDGAEGNQRPDARRSGTEPTWVGTADGVEAAVTTTDGTTVQDAKVVLIQPGFRAADNDPPTTPEQPIEPEASRAPYAMPRIVGRPGWGADEKLRSHNGAACAKPKFTSTVQAAFVHHTADTNNYTSAQVPAMIRGMYTYHVKSRGWCDLGYNFLVDKFGRAWEGRYGGMQLPVLGAHTGSFNANSFGVSLIGNFDKVAPTAKMMEMTARIVAWKLDANYRSPLATVVLDGSKLGTVSGHRDTKATACPGKNLYSKLGWLKQRVNALMGKSVSTEIYRRAQQHGGYRAIGQPFWGEHPTRTGRATYFGALDIYWSARTGAWSVRGGFKAQFRKIGPDGFLGMPTGEQRNGKIGGSRKQPFRNGALYWSPKTGMFPVAGLISRTYGAFGAEGSRLGLPTSGIYKVNGGQQQRFQHGTLTSSTRTQKVYIS